MTHLTDEQLDERLDGSAERPEHLADCSLCRQRLADRRALRDRLHAAMASVQPPADLADRIRHRLDTVSAPAKARLSFRQYVRNHHLFWPAVAAAAVVLAAVPVLVHLAAPPRASAAEAELYRIHQDGLRPGPHVYASSDPAALAAYLKGKLGFDAATPRPNAGMALRACCVAHFRNTPAGTYVVDTDRGIISVIVVTQTTDELGMDGWIDRPGRRYVTGSFATSNMAAFRRGNYTYCAVGEVSKDYLADLLDQLIPPAGK